MHAFGQVLVLIRNELFLDGLPTLLLGRLPTCPTIEGTEVNTVKLPQIRWLMATSDMAYGAIGEGGLQKVVMDDPSLLWGFYREALTAVNRLSVEMRENLLSTFSGPAGRPYSSGKTFKIGWLKI